MPIETKTPPELSPEVLRAVEGAVQLSEQLNGIFPRNFTHTHRADFTLRYMSLALDHREAIILLVRHGARSSAYALVRSVYEACTRGHWMQFAATDQEIATGDTTGVLPAFDKMVRRLSNVQGPSYSSLKQSTWERFSDFAHGGWRQLQRWASPNGIEPVHPDGEVVRLLFMLDMLAIQATAGVLAAVGTDANALGAILQEVLRRKP